MEQAQLLIEGESVSSSDGRTFDRVLQIDLKVVRFDVTRAPKRVQRLSIGTFKRALEFSPDDQRALDNLADAHAGEYGEVINLLQQRARASNDPQQRFDLLSPRERSYYKRDRCS